MAKKTSKKANAQHSVNPKKDKGIKTNILTKKRSQTINVEQLGSMRILYGDDKKTYDIS